MELVLTFKHQLLHCSSKSCYSSHFTIFTISISKIAALTYRVGLMYNGQLSMQCSFVRWEEARVNHMGGVQTPDRQH